MDLSKIADSLQQRPDGLWISSGQGQISYPEDGNQNCLLLEGDSFWFKHRSRCIESIIHRFPPNGPVFDIGGGNGYVAAGLQQAGIPVVLVEPGWQGAQNARSRGINDVVCSTLDDAKFHNQSLPAVGLFDVLEHIGAEHDFLISIYRLLVPGGRVYITAPAYQALWSAADDYAGHIKRYTTRSLAQALTSAGFSIQFSSYMFWMLPVPMLFFRVIPSRLGWQKPDDWQRYQSEHTERPGAAGQWVDRLLDWELSQIRLGKPVWFGGSCLAVAVK